MPSGRYSGGNDDRRCDFYLFTWPYSVGNADKIINPLGCGDDYQAANRADGNTNPDENANPYLSGDSH